MYNNENDDTMGFNSQGNEQAAGVQPDVQTATTETSQQPVDNAYSQPDTTYRYAYGSVPYGTETAGTTNGTYGSTGQSYGGASGAYGSTGQTYGSASGIYGSTGQTYGSANGTYGAGQPYGTGATYGTEAKADEKQPKVKKVKPKKEKKPAGFAKKACRFVAAAVLFGAISGATMYGAYYAGVSIAPVSNSDYEISSVSSSVSQLTSNTSDIQADVSLTNTSMNVEAVAQAALPAMVALTGKTTVSGSSSYYGYGTQSYQATTSGTGIIVGKNDTELLILTNAHVVDEVNNLTCVFIDEAQISCTVKGSKSDQDIAVVAVNLSDIPADTLSAIAIAELANSADVVLGQEVVAIGNALGEGQSVTNGIISALDRSITLDSGTFTGLIMTNAAINSGNSGGALLNAEGKVIAINFAKTATTGVEGMAYSIPVSNVSDLIDSLMTRETRTKVSDSEASYLGISGLDITASDASRYGYPQGVLIQKVTSGTAAEAAGLSSYDIIVSFDDQTVSSMTGLTSIMQYYKAGETVDIDYYHLEGSEYVLKTVSVTLGSRN